jgi:hypothetical protein
MISQNDSTPVRELMINRFEIVIDDDHTDRVELYVLDDANKRIEGGTFSRAAFMDWILEFYRRNY